MAVNTLGKVVVTTAGTIVQATATRTPVHSIRIQALSSNTGKIFIGLSTLVASTFVGCIAVLGIPAATGSLPEITINIELAPEGLNLADIWLDAGVNGEGVLISYTQQ